MGITRHIRRIEKFLALKDASDETILHINREIRPPDIDIPFLSAAGLGALRLFYFPPVAFEIVLDRSGVFQFGFESSVAGGR